MTRCWHFWRKSVAVGRRLCFQCFSREWRAWCADKPELHEPWDRQPYLGPDPVDWAETTKDKECDHQWIGRSTKPAFVTCAHCSAIRTTKYHESEKDTL